MRLPFRPGLATPALLRRSPSLYRLTPDASGGRWDLLRVSREFDAPQGELTEDLIEHLNDWAAGESVFSGLALRGEEPKRLPSAILFLDGSPSRMPLTAETARVASAHLAERGLSIPTRVVNLREELLERVARAPRETLVVSQAAQRSLYDARLAEALVSRGVVVVPGPLTAPGGPLSNKKTTYELLNGVNLDPEANGYPSRLTARYQTVEVNGGSAAAAAEAILDAAARLSREWRTTALFVKPQEGGGGRGCFRIDAFPEGFALPDLSRLGTAAERVVPLPLPLDPANRSHLKALAWLGHRFEASPATSKAYLHGDRLRPWGGVGTTALLGRLLRECRPSLEEGLRRAAEPRHTARERLARAIENYEQLFGVPYRPLICDWIDFGLFSVRAHFRLGRRGPLLEALYARLFPIEFTDKSVGIVGVDSIANRTEGGMEFNRYSPLLPVLADSVGGAEALCARIHGAFHAFARFVALLPPEERERLPVRAEFDLSPLNGLIAEGNADPVRAQCPNSRWERFCANCQAWMEDALSYYSWKSGEG